MIWWHSRDLVRRSNCILQTFAGVDPFLKTKLVHAFCLSLYNSSPWKLFCNTISIIEVSFNKVLRKVCMASTTELSHTAIVHCTARIYNAVYLRSRELLHGAICSSSVAQCVFLDASYLCYTFIGCNTIYGDHVKGFTMCQSNQKLQITSWMLPTIQRYQHGFYYSIF